MTTAGDLIDRTKHRWLEPSLRHPLNRLSGSVATGDTTVTLTYTAGDVQRGKQLGIDQEVLYVWDYDASTKQATVDRGWKGTVAASHDDGSLVDVGAKWFRSDVLNALADEVLSWPTTLYRVVAATASVGRGQSTVDLPTPLVGCYGLVDARINGHPHISTTTYDSWNQLRYAKLVSGMPSANYASGTMVRLGVNASRSTTVALVGALPFDIAPFDEDTDFETVGMSESMADLACIGAAARLVQGTEIGRVDRTSQGESRRAEEVPVMGATQTASGLRALRQSRLRDESQRLQSIYPIRIR